MKKNYSYYILLALMFFTAPLSQAAVTSINDLFGKYKFTATMEVTEAGKAYTSSFSNDCEVTIEESSSSYYKAQIVGLAGASGKENMMINDIDLSAYTLTVKNPGGINAYTFDNSITVANIDGGYPYIPANDPKITFTYDPATKAMTISDFTLVGNVNHSAQTCDIYAKFTNAKLTLVESSKKLDDLSGEWDIVAGSQDYSTWPTSTLPTSYSLTLAQTSEGVYTAQFDITGVPSFSLDGTFDGAKLTLNFDNKVVDSANSITIKDFNTGGTTGTVTFTYADDVLTGVNPLYLANASGIVQYWSNATGTRKSADTFTWDGTYTVSTTNLFALDGGSWANPFEVTITENNGSYYVSSFLGNNVYSLNYGSMKLTVADDNKSASICIDGGKSGYSSAYLKYDSDGTFYHFCDINAKRTSLTMTRQDDGTIKLDDFGFLKGSWDATPAASAAAAWYISNTMSKSTSGVSSVAIDNKVNIGVNGSNIVLDGAQLVSVYDFSGRVVYRGFTNVVSGLTNGLYIVKANDTVAKVAIR